MQLSHFDQALVRDQLGKLLESVSFKRSERASSLLKYLVEEALAGRGDGLKEYIVAVEALGRDESFDPRIDPIVRAEASRLRRRLEQYYEKEGSGDPVEISLPKGSYVPQFVMRSVATSGETDPVVRPPKALRRRGFPALSAAVVLCLAAAAVLFWKDAEPPIAASEPLMRFDIDLNAEGVLGSEVGTHLTLSPDGSNLIFVTRDAAGVSHLNSRRLADSSAIRLPETNGARNPFISPDGKWVGFWSGGKIKKISVAGGAPVVLCEALDLLGAAWNSDGTIIAAVHPSRRLWKIPENGGDPEELLDVSSESANPVWPHILPGGRSIIFTTLTGLGADRGNIEIFDLRSKERRVIIRGGTFAKYLPDGFLSYMNQGTLFAVRFDAERGEVIGSAVPVLENISYSRTFGYAQFDISRTGVIVFRSGDENDRFVIDWFDRAGNSSPLLTRPGRYEWLKLSNDGRRLAFASIDSGAASISVLDTVNGEVQRMTATEDAYTSAVWVDNDSSLIVGGRGGMARIDARDPKQRVALTAGGSVQVPWSLAPDLSRLLYYELVPETGFDLFAAPLSVRPDGVDFGPPEPLLRTAAYECYPTLSPDGRWLAYSSNETGTWEVYVRPNPDNGTKIKISATGGSLPFWSDKGQELFYRTWDNKIMIMAYRVQDGEFIVHGSIEWPALNLGDTGVLPNFDIARDGKKIAAFVNRSNGEDSKNKVTFLLNFSSEVKRRSVDDGARE